MAESRPHHLPGRRVFIKRALTASMGLAMASCARLPGPAQSSVPAGRLVMIDIPGPELDPETAAFIMQHQIRGVLLFQYNILNGAQTRQLTSDLRRLMGPEALIAVDQEGGAIVRTRDLPFPPSAMSLGAGGSTETAYAVGAAVGRMLNGLGINWNFAPVLDVNNNSLNPVIADRSFGSDPQLVARLGLAWAQGCMSAGVAPCVKHFPGHGDTHTDSHTGMPVVGKSLDQLQTLELRPFRAAVEAGLPCIMTAHILFPAIDAERPATLSPAILGDLLREEWGYDGVVITDAMNMQAITDRYGRGPAGMLALQAGADIVLAQGTREAQQETLSALQTALADGKLIPDQKLRRLSALAAQYPAEAAVYTDEQLRQDAELFQRAWEAGLTPYRNPRPPQLSSQVLLVMADSAAGGGAADRGLRSSDFVDMLRDLYDLRAVLYDERNPLASLTILRESKEPGVTTIFVSTGRQRPDPNLQTLLSEAAPDLHIALWNPYTVLDVAAPALLTYGFRPEALRAATAWLKGEISANGRLPIALNGTM
jgi:beta-N-acetylhexosaminidase